MFPGQAPSGFDDLIQRKYAQQQFGLDTQRLDAIARANLANAQAGAVAPITASQVEESKAKSGLFNKQGLESQARSGLYGAQAQSEAVRNQWYGPEAQARINLDNSSAGLNKANSLGPNYLYGNNLDPSVAAAAYGKAAAQQNGGVFPLVTPGGGTPSGTSVTPGAGLITQDDDDGGHRAGTARIAGKGDGTKDTVKTRLAPGEAVLNRAAADMMGRGLIAHANRLGMAKMGMVDARKVSAAPAGYKRGASGVGMKKAPPMDAAALTAFLRTMGGGAPQQGGMPEAVPVGPGLGLMGAGGGSPVGSPQGAPLAVGAGLMGAQPASRGRGMP